MSEMTAGLNYESEYYRKCKELEDVRIELEMERERVSDLEAYCIEAQAIKRTLYVIFGRSFSNE